MEWERKLDRDWDGVGEGVGWSGKRAVWSWRGSGTEWGKEWEREWTRERDEDEVRVVGWSGRGSGIMWKRQ